MDPPPAGDCLLHANTVIAMMNEPTQGRLQTQSTWYNAMVQQSST